MVMAVTIQSASWNVTISIVTMADSWGCGFSRFLAQSRKSGGQSAAKSEGV